MDDRFRSRIDLSVVWPGAGFDRVDSGIEIVSSGRTHGGGLEASVELEPLGRQLIEVWRFGLASIHLHVQIGAIICEDKDHVGWRVRSRKGSGEQD